MDEFASIHTAAEKAIISDKKLRDELGNNIICDPPFSSGMSSMDVNGKKTKKISLIFDITGELSSGRATVSATIEDNGAPKLQDLSVAVKGGGIILVKINSKHQSNQIIDV